MTPLGVLLISGGHERAHYALMLATAAAALGRPVTLLATNAGTALLLGAQPLLADPREAGLAAAGVAGIATLLDAARDMQVGLLACEAGLAAEGLRDAALMAGAERTGLVSFLVRVGTGQLVTL